MRSASEEEAPAPCIGVPNEWQGHEVAQPARPCELTASSTMRPQAEASSRVHVGRDPCCTFPQG